MGTTEITAKPGVPFIEFVREFDAPRDLVFRAHTEPDLLAQWLGPAKYKMTVERLEVRDGGTWRYINSGPDGAEYGFHGVFHGTPTPERMVQTFEFEGAPGHVSLDTLSLEEKGGRTFARGRSVFESVEDRDAMFQGGMADGMTEGYERLDQLLARLAVPAR
jgi:uncharacterized protein YndB with AHSA1/START domain